MLKKITDQFWIKTFNMKLAGIPFPTHCSIVRLGDGSLWMNSPVPFLDEDVNEIKKLGEVKYIISPNSFHHLFIAKAKAHFPAARTFGGPITQKRRGTELVFDEIMGPDFQAPWDEDIKSYYIKGCKIFEERFFYHVSSRSLIFTDFAFNNQPRSFAHDLFWRIYGSFGYLKSSHLLKMVVRDRKSARTTIDQVLKLDLDRIVPGHGVYLEGPGMKDKLKNATHWIGN